MKNTNKLLTLSLALIASLSLVSCGGGTSGGTSNSTGTTSTETEKMVSSLTVKSLPTKTSYYIDETFDSTGAVITITYSDSTTEDVALTDSRLTVSSPNMSTEGTKNIVVSYGGQRVTFQITVAAETFVVTFDYNYDGAEDTTVEVKKGETVSKPTDPTRTDYTFDGWYTSTALSDAYDFSTAVSSSFTLYAKWLDNSKKTYTFTFDMNCYELTYLESASKLTVEEGSTVTAISDPERKGYDFAGWMTSASGSTTYDFTTAVNADTTVYASWTRNSEFTGEQTYTFEAEDSSLAGKVGPGASGTATETAMIVRNTSIGASNDRFVSYLYKNGMSLEFYFYSDKAVDNATLVLRLSQEMSDYTYSSDNFAVRFNGSPLTYSGVSFTGVPAQTDAVPYAQCQDFTISTEIDLLAGMNLVQLVTTNSDAYAGTTMTAHAPLVDCVKLTTSDSAVLGWDGNKGLPATNY